MLARARHCVHITESHAILYFQVVVTPMHTKIMSSIMADIARQFKWHPSSIGFNPEPSPFKIDDNFCFVWWIDPEYEGGIGHFFFLTNYYPVQNNDVPSVLTVKMFDSLSTSHGSVSKQLARSMAGKYVYHHLFCLVIEHAHVPSFTTYGYMDTLL